VHGEIWRAVAEAAVRPGAGVRVAAVRGLTLTVEPDAGRGTPPFIGSEGVPS
jgi:membrane-bound ClpP family serine protease